MKLTKTFWPETLPQTDTEDSPARNGSDWDGAEGPTPFRKSQPEKIQEVMD